MTEAEQKLLALALDVSIYDSDQLRDLDEARNAVLFERLPEGYENNLKQLTERCLEANRALGEYVSRHPLGNELSKKYREEWRERNKL